MSTFLVTVSDEYEVDAADVKIGIASYMEQGKEWRLDLAVEEIEVIHKGKVGHAEGDPSAGLSYIVKDAA